MEKILLLGAGGQLGQALCEGVIAPGYETVAVSRKELDLNDTHALTALLQTLRPVITINAAAFTAVDAAESQSAAAFAVNTDAVATLAAGVRELDAYLIHVSTDFVFNGRQSRPYVPEDETGPLGVYGRSKLAGEQAVTASLPRGCIIRTSWLYSPYGNNFVKTMLRLMREREELSVVDDQVGTPCSVFTLADCIRSAVMKRPAGIFHWSDAGVASWYDFAQAIQEEGLALGLLERRIPVRPIPSSAYPTPATRPAFSVLDKRRTVSELGCVQQHWREALREVLRRINPTTSGSLPGSGA